MCTDRRANSRLSPGPIRAYRLPDALGGVSLSDGPRLAAGLIRR